MFALTLATGALGQWSIDTGRHARERQHLADYLRHSYYENWLVGLEKLLQESGLVAAEELASGRAAASAAEAVRARVLTAGKVGPAMAKSGPVEVAIDAPPRFASASGCARATGIRAAIPGSAATCAAARA